MRKKHTNQWICNIFDPEISPGTTMVVYLEFLDLEKRGKTQHPTPMVFHLKKLSDRRVTLL